MTRNDATEAQVRAAHPGRSTWLSANAGSGKTRVLTDRVARLLLDEVRPDHILCLTYTKAAASEMQNRLFKRLGGWAMLPDAALLAELAELGADTAGPGRLDAARQLFARAIETPGGLRIQTIHSFCAALLRRFPLEAGVTPQFTEMEDRAAEMLRAEILDDMAAGPEVGVLRGVAAYIGDLSFDAIAGQVASARQGFDPGLDQPAIWAAYDLHPGDSLQAILDEVFDAGTDDLLTALAGHMAQGGKTDVKQAADLTALVPGTEAALLSLEKLMLFGAKTKTKAPFAAKIGGFPSKATQKAAADLMPEVEDLMARVEAARPRRLGLAAAQRDLALHRFAEAFLPRYALEKQKRGWLDFDDLIDRTRALMDDPTVAQWVLYRLDGGLDHILVDEAQDTSPAQWAVITRLAQEFTAGEGAKSGLERTIFVVGDKKQSIYSFQGADAAEFDRMREDFSTRLRDLGPGLQQMSLAYSFRSAPEILAAVDATFDGRAGSGFDDDPHRAFRAQMPGRVDLWPLVPKVETPEPADWRAPVDHISPEHHTVRLARRIAGQIAQMLADRVPLPLPDGGARPITAGDILILVRTRKPLFAEIIRACKAQGLPIAGADRLSVMKELAVRDIIACLSFLDTPEDDLALATVLRSPLFGIDEQALFDLAHHRAPRAHLWEAMRGAERFAAERAVLQDLRDQADFLRPYELIDRLLTRHEGRARLVGRLGEEAADGIDALMGQALAYEQTEVPSLTGFLQWARGDALEIKREAAGAGDKLRVMTVHGAKGLEAPVVILPDCDASRGASRGGLVRDDAGVMWQVSAEVRPTRQQAQADAQRLAAEAEDDRLLYVAMTRAETWLIVAAVDNLDKGGRDWYSQVQMGMARAGAVPHPFDFGAEDQGEGLRLQGDWPATAAEAPGVDAEPVAALPGWAEAQVPRESPEPVYSPSDLGGAKALPGQGDMTEVAMARGTALHLLLEHLPQVAPGDWPAVADRLLPAGADGPAMLAEAAAVLQDPICGPFFAADVLAEVPVSGEVPGIGPMLGVIDRLVVKDTLVQVIDIKSNRAVPQTAAACPAGLLRQMGAYVALVAPLFPGRQIRSAILWTQGPLLMDLPHDLVTDALRHAELDVGGGAS